MGLVVAVKVTVGMRNGEGRILINKGYKVIL